MSKLVPSSNQSLSTQRVEPPSGGPASIATVLPRIDFAEILRAIRRRWWVPVFTALLIGGLVYYQVSKQPKLYQSTGSIYVKTSEPVIFDGGLATEDAKDLEQMKTVEQGILSSNVLLRLAEKHNLASDPSYGVGSATKQALVDVMLSRITVELRKGTRLIDIAVLDTNPRRAAAMVEDLVNEYEVEKENGRVELIAKTSMSLSEQEKRLREKMEKSEDVLREFREQNPVLNLVGGQPGQTGNTLEMLNRELTTATAERLRLEAEYMAMQNSASRDNRTLAAKGEQSQLVLELERELANLEAAFAELKTRYGPKHPKYIELNDRIVRVKEQIASVAAQAGESLKNRYLLAVQQQEKLADLVVKAKDKALEEDSLRETFANLQRAVEIDRDLHSRVATQLQENQINSSLTSSVLRWDARPLEPDHAKYPRKGVFTAGGVFLGGVLGLFLGVLLEILDRRVREGSGVERVIGVPQLASLPVYDARTIGELSVSGAISRDRVRSLHMSRFTFTPRPETDEMEAVMFASAFEGDGKTVCVLKCARTLVKQGYRTLVIDADFRNPGLSRLYGGNGRGKHGLTSYLTGESEAAEVLFETGLPGLWFLPSGHIEGNPSDYLAGPGFKKLLEAVQPMFDRVVFDVSATTVSDDVQAVARHVNATYFVARKGAGKYRDLKSSMDTLRSAGARVIGFIWNEGGGSRSRKEDTPFIEPLRLVEEQGKEEGFAGRVDEHRERGDRATG